MHVYILLRIELHRRFGAEFFIVTFREIEKLVGEITMLSAVALLCMGIYLVVTVR